MSNRCVTSGTHSGQTRLPPIPRKYDTTQKATTQNFENDNLLFCFPRLPQIDGPPLSVQTKIPSIFQEREGNHKTFNRRVTISEKLPPARLDRAAELQSTRKFEKLNRNEMTSVGFDTGREDGIQLEGEHSNNGMVEVNLTGEHDYSPKKEMDKITPIAENAFRRPVHLLRRRLKPARVYRHNNGQMSHEELLAFDENINIKLRAFTQRDAKMEVKEFYGKKIDSDKTENGDITSYTTMVEFEKKESSSGRKNRGASTNNRENKLSSKKGTKDSGVERHFFEALDLHFYHYYRNAHSGRRMAICDEIEQSIFVENIPLSCYRNNLRLQEILESWML